MIKLFNEVPIEEVFKSVLRSVYHSLNSIKSFKGQDIELRAKQFADQYKINITKLDRDNISGRPELGTISGSSFPRSYDVDRRKEYPNAYIFYSIPFKGDRQIFRVRPNTGIEKRVTAEVDSNILTISLSADYATLDIPVEKREEIKKRANGIIDQIESALNQVNKEIIEFNSSLAAIIVNEIKKRIEQENKMDDLTNDLKI